MGGRDVLAVDCCEWEGGIGCGWFWGGVLGRGIGDGRLWAGGLIFCSSQRWTCCLFFSFTLS